MGDSDDIEDFLFDDNASPQSNQLSFSLSDRRMSEDIYHRESSDSYWSSEQQHPAQVPVSSAMAGRRSSAARMRSHTMSSLSSIESLNTQAMDVSPPASSREHLSQTASSMARGSIDAAEAEASQRSSAYSNWVSNQAIIGEQSLLSQLAHEELKRTSAALGLNEKRQAAGEGSAIQQASASSSGKMADDDGQLPCRRLQCRMIMAAIGSVGERSSGILEFVSSSVSQTRVIPRLVKINQTSARPPVPQRTSSTLPVLLPPAVVTSLPTQPTDPFAGLPRGPGHVAHWQPRLEQVVEWQIQDSDAFSAQAQAAWIQTRRISVQEPSAADVPAKSAPEIPGAQTDAAAGAAQGEVYAGATAQEQHGKPTESNVR
ncbi:hypothetical protein DL89DRAFT_75946 [Linderina pennispora]|uniref:Uncharacterized protein n=1 Tax=Linderina pennispora TaxID=61395 RepID=A0A1Y1VXM9_9FUNG|nr:uncharacterized protein DL89DRAFT_75946 [Linderina pennispora]ORX66048.1 hypothetical protein DL89DRAFT_75946 [Linderina pennispora]